jgi:hypothetical protein
MHLRPALSTPHFPLCSNHGSVFADIHWGSQRLLSKPALWGGNPVRSGDYHNVGGKSVVDQGDLGEEMLDQNMGDFGDCLNTGTGTCTPPPAWIWPNPTYTLFPSTSLYMSTSKINTPA